MASGMISDACYTCYLSKLLRVVMEAITYSYARKHLAKVMNKVGSERSQVLITRRTGKPVVMISLQDFNALEETTYLMRGPKSAKKLIESIEQLTSGGQPG